MNRSVVAAVAAAIFASSATLAQTDGPRVVPQQVEGGAITAVVAPPASPEGHPDKLFVEADTMIRLMVLNEVSTKIAKAGDRFPLRVDEDVVVNGVTIIPVGSKAWGEVLSTEESGIAGKSGKLGARLLFIELNGDRIPLSGEARTAGASGTAETVMGVIALGPFGLFARGNNAKLKAGDIFNGYLDGDMLFDPATSKLIPTQIGNEVAAVPVAISATQEIQ